MCERLVGNFDGSRQIESGWEGANLKPQRAYDAPESKPANHRRKVAKLQKKHCHKMNGLNEIYFLFTRSTRNTRS